MGGRNEGFSFGCKKIFTKLDINLLWYFVFFTASGWTTYAMGFLFIHVYPVSMMLSRLYKTQFEICYIIRNHCTSKTARPRVVPKTSKMEPVAFLLGAQHKWLVQGQCFTNGCGISIWPWLLKRDVKYWNKPNILFTMTLAVKKGCKILKQTKHFIHKIIILNGNRSAQEIYI